MSCIWNENLILNQYICMPCIWQNVITHVLLKYMQVDAASDSCLYTINYKVILLATTFTTHSRHSCQQSAIILWSYSENFCYNGRAVPNDTGEWDWSAMAFWCLPEGSFISRTHQCCLASLWHSTTSWKHPIISSSHLDYGVRCLHCKFWQRWTKIHRKANSLQHTLAMCTRWLASIAFPVLTPNLLQPEVLTRLFSKTILVHKPISWPWVLRLATTSLQLRTTLEDSRRLYTEHIPPTMSLAIVASFWVNLLMKEWSLVQWRLSLKVGLKVLRL